MKKIAWHLLNSVCRPAQFTREGIRNILVIRMNRIGDMICTIPLLKTLRKEFPEARLTVLAEETNVEIIRDASYIDEVVAYRKRKGLFRNKHRELRRILKGVTFDLAIGVKGGFSSNLAIATFMSRARYRVGYAPDDYHPLGLLYNLPVDSAARTGHQIEQCLNLLGPVGIGPESYVRDISLEIPESSRASTRHFLLRNNITAAPGKIVVLNISNSSVETTWSHENFIGLLKKLREHRFIPILTSAPADIGKAERMASASGSPLLRTPHVMDLAAAAEISDLFICHDSGAMHVAAAAGAKTLVLVGRGITPEVWGPYGEGHTCIKKNGIAGITVSEVFDQALAMLTVANWEK